MNHDEVMHFLHSFSERDLYELGIALGISHKRLTDPNRRHLLGDLIMDWLLRVDKVDSKGKPSWRTLVRALRDPMVNQIGVANTIAAVKPVQLRSVVSF